MGLTKIRNPIDIKEFNYRNIRDIRDIRGSCYYSHILVTSSVRQNLNESFRYKDVGLRLCLKRK